MLFINILMTWLDVKTKQVTLFVTKNLFSETGYVYGLP